MEYRYSSTLSLTSTIDGVGGQRHSPAALPRERLRTPCIGGWAGPRAGLVPNGIRSPDRPVRSESLYRLSCPVPLTNKQTNKHNYTKVIRHKTIQVTKLIKSFRATIIFCSVYQGIIIQYCSKTLYVGGRLPPIPM